MFTPQADTGAKRARLIKTRLGRQTLIGLLVLPALALPMQAAADARVPLEGLESGTFQLLGPCQTSGVVLEVTGSGRSTMLGNYRGLYRECLDPATGAVSDGSFTLTAANGAQVFGTYSGHAGPTSDPAVVTYTDPGVITGGTGRFAAARGTITTSGLANLATGEYQGTISGGLSNPAASMRQRVAGAAG